jgi:hypothetical protein
MLHRAQKFFEIFATQRPAMFLFAKHDRVVEIKNNPPIGALKQAELKFIEANGFEEHDEIVLSRLLQNAQSFGHARTPRWQDRRFDPEAGIVIKTIPQPQPGARSVTVFDDAKYFHFTGREESLFLQLPRLPFQRLRSRFSCRSAIAVRALDLLVSGVEGRSI